MENASKALIIAGAILLAILLISLGILIFSQAQDVVQNNGMTQAEITAFNAKWTKYEGSQKGSVVKTMIQEVMASNADSNNASRRVLVVDESEKDSTNPTTLPSSDISPSTIYEIELKYDNNTGCVSRIIVK